MPCPPPGNLSDPGIKPMSHASPALQVDSLQPPGKPECIPISVQRLDLINSCPELGVKGRPNFKGSRRRFGRRLSASIPLSPCRWCYFSFVSDSFVTLWTVACQAPLTTEFSQQESWKWLPFLIVENLLDPGIETLSLEPPARAGTFFTTVSPGKPIVYGNGYTTIKTYIC